MKRPGFILFAILVVWFLIWRSDKDDPEREVDREAKRCEDTTMAFVMSQTFVKRQLKSPATAEFPYSSTDGVSIRYLGDCRHTVVAFVDAQNAFGATLRSRYVATLKYVGDGNWQAESVAIE